MKHLLLILALFVGSSFAEDEFPIELTCEIGEAIFHINVAKVPEKTWVKIVSSPKYSITNNSGWWQNQKLKNKKNPNKI